MNSWMSVRRVPFVLAGLALVASGLVARVATPAVAVAGPGPTYSLATVGAFGGEPSIASDSKGVLYETTPICHVGYQVTAMSCTASPTPAPGPRPPAGQRASGPRLGSGLSFFLFAAPAILRHQPVEGGRSYTTGADASRSVWHRR